MDAAVERREFMESWLPQYISRYPAISADHLTAEAIFIDSHLPPKTSPGLLATPESGFSNLTNVGHQLYASRKTDKSIYLTSLQVLHDISKSPIKGWHLVIEDDTWVNFTMLNLLLNEVPNDADVFKVFSYCPHLELIDGYFDFTMQDCLLPCKVQDKICRFDKSMYKQTVMGGQIYAYKNAGDRLAKLFDALMLIPGGHLSSNLQYLSDNFNIYGLKPDFGNCGSLFTMVTAGKAAHRAEKKFMTSHKEWQSCLVSPESLTFEMMRTKSASYSVSEAMAISFTLVAFIAGTLSKKMRPIII